MARPSKLTDSQWEKIGQRLLKGEKAADLAREFGVSKAAMSRKFSQRTAEIKDVGADLARVEQRVAALPIADQIAVRSVADRLKSLSENLMSSAELGAMTSHRLAAIAHDRVQYIPDTGPLDDEARTELSTIAGLRKMANEAAELGINLIRANKETVEKINALEMEKATAAAAAASQIGSGDAIEASKAYQKIMQG